MPEQPEEDDYQVPVQLHETWWVPILGALLFLGWAWYQFRELEQLEAGTRDWVRLHVFQKLLYYAGGKWAAVAFSVVVALPLLGVGIRRLLTDPRRLS